MRKQSYINLEFVNYVVNIVNVYVTYVRHICFVL